MVGESYACHATATRRDDRATRAAGTRSGDRSPAARAAESPAYRTTCTSIPEHTLAEAQRLLDAGFPFQAHEVLEAAWKSAPDAERDLWQGLAQLAVGLTHALRGNATGAAALLARGADRLSGYAGTEPYGVDVAGLVTWARTGASDPVAAPRLRRGNVGSA